MRIHRLNRENGQVFAVEIENAYIGIRKVATLLRGVDGVSDISLRKFLSSSSDIHLRFKYQGNDFIVWEPYSDSSRYWIGPNQEDDATDISLLERAFEEYQPPLMVKIFGDLITLNFKSLFKRIV